MKTPNRITLIRDDNIQNYDPVEDKYVLPAEKTQKNVPCLINFIKQAKVFKEYGNQTDTIMICRFQQEQQPFTKAFYEGRYYSPIDKIDAPIKGAVRLKRI